MDSITTTVICEGCKSLRGCRFTRPEGQWLCFTCKPSPMATKRGRQRRLVRRERARGKR